MRRLVLQMQSSLDGFIEAETPEMRWQVWNWNAPITWDRALIADFNMTISRADTVLLSRPMIDGGYLNHWKSIATGHPRDARFAFARRIGEMEKVVVSRSTLAFEWPRTRTLNGDLSEHVLALKAEDGGDIIAFGGVRFAAALSIAGLVDEYQFYVNPTPVGDGQRIPPPAGSELVVVDAQNYSCGVVVQRFAAIPSVNE